MKILQFILASLIFVSLSSCEDDTTDSPSNSSGSNVNIKTALEGTWLLQNIPNSSILTFVGNRFTIQAGTVTITGTFAYTGNTFNGTVTGRSGANSGSLTPDSFSGNASFSSNGSTVTFTNFSGNWSAVFSTWYGKI